MATLHASHQELKKDFARGREIHSHLIASAKAQEDGWDALWLWQCWQERVMAHLNLEDRQTFMNLKVNLAGRAKSLAYSSGCLASELEYLENLLKSVKLATQAMSTNRILLTDFVLTELNIGLQFADLARDSYLRTCDADGHRQKTAAIHAFQTVKSFLAQVDPAQTQRIMIEQRVAELETAISRLQTLNPTTAP
jgi:hypothetical protein